jgi:3-oxoacyl-[acyl-carrier-protein] synthase III
VTVSLAGAGAALPDRVLKNSYFDDIGSSDEWIVKRTGIRERRWLDDRTPLADLAVSAAGRALADAGLGAQQVQQVVVATSTADRISPGLAVEVATRLGADRPAAFDVSAGCSGFLYALDHAIAAIESGRAENVLVCGAEALSRITDKTDRDTAVLMGDGAGAVVVRASPGVLRPSFTLGSDGEQIELLYVGKPDGLLRMRGRDIYAHAVDAMVDSTRLVLRSRGLEAGDVDLFVAHQANARIVRTVAERLGLPEKKVFLNIERVANTSAASIPIALAHAQREGALEPGALLGLATFGAGLSWGAGVISWKPAAAA